MLGHKFTHLHTQTPPQTIYQAVVSEDIQAVTHLLATGVDPNLKNENGNTPLHFLASNFFNESSNRTVMAQLLLEKGADPNLQNPKGDTPLHFLAADFCCENADSMVMVQLLLEKGADPNLQNQKGRTPLHKAVIKENGSMVNILLASEKTKVDLPDKFGGTPLFYAVNYRSLFDSLEDIIRTLLEHGASPNYQNKNGETLLHIAARKGCRYTIDMLIKYGVEVNVQNKAGETPLYIAVVVGASKVVERLIESGADVNIECNEGYTPFYLAATGWFSYYSRGNQPEDRPLFEMVCLFLDKKGASIDWKDEAYRKRLWQNVQDKRIAKLLIFFFSESSPVGSMGNRNKEV